MNPSKPFLKKSIFAAAALLCGVAAAGSALAASSDPARIERKLLKNGNLTTEVFSQGKGPIIMILPSLGRSVRDYDAVAVDLAKAGFRVVRPEPRGVPRRSRRPRAAPRGRCRSRRPSPHARRGPTR